MRSGSPPQPDPNTMSSDTPPSSPIESLVAAASGESARLLAEFAQRLHEHHVQQRDEAVAALRHEAEEALRLVREESERTLERAVGAADAQASARIAEAAHQQTREAEQRLADESARLRAEFDEQQRQWQSEAEERQRSLEARLRAEFDEARRQAQVGADQAQETARAEAERALQETEARLRAEHGASLEATRAEGESRLAALMAAPVAAEPEILVRQAGEREQRLAAVERLLRAFEGLDQATSLRGALDVLAQAVAAEAPRSLVFVVRGTALRGWRASGISGAQVDVASLSLGIEASGPLGVAVSTGEPAGVHAHAISRDTEGAIAFLDLPEDRAGLAVPVVVDGKAVALVYVDDGGANDPEVPASWPEAVQVIARHTARCLESLTARRAAAARSAPAVAEVQSLSTAPHAAPALPMAADVESARRFARLLVSELKLYNESVVDAGRRARDLRVRLAEPIARARRQYELRVPATLPGRDEYFEQELVRTLAEGDPDMLGGRGLATA